MPEQINTNMRIYCSFQAYMATGDEKRGLNQSLSNQTVFKQKKLLFNPIVELCLETPRFKQRAVFVLILSHNVWITRPENRVFI
jgi:hypothetical protein